MAAAGEGKTRIARTLGAGTGTVGNWCEAHGVVLPVKHFQQLWTEAERQVIARGFHAGVKVDDIRMELPHRTRESIYLQMYSMGLTNKRNPDVARPPTAKNGNNSLPKRIVPAETVVGRPHRDLSGGDCLQAGHPETWGLLLAHTPSIAGVPYEPHRWV
jgi:hypothetical protein